MSDQRKQGIAGMFGRAAPTYDQVGPRFFSHIGRRMVELSQLRPGAKVLDVASGRGASLFPAAQQVGGEGWVVGIDLADGMVEGTAAEAQRLGLNNVEVRQMDAENLDFPDASFDDVLCGFAIFFVDADRALAEFKRVLKPGGQVTVTTWGRDDGRWSWIGDLGKKYAPLLPPPMQAMMSGNNPPDPRPFNTPEGMQARFADAGFENIRVIELDLEFKYADAEEWIAVQQSHGNRLWFEMLPPDAFENYKNDARTYLNAMPRQPHGIPHALYTLVTLANKP
jgi:ubiquinone/menaquinone biosynthesis C-methylase UbiE